MTANNEFTTRRIVFTIFYLLLWPALLLFLSGDWFWTEGWIFSIWFILTSTSITIYLYFRDPALLAERYRKLGTGDQKSWDRIFFIVFIVVYLGWVVIIPFDSKRFMWTMRYPVTLKYIGGVFLLLSGFFLFRSFSDNTFLSPLIRIQKERKQQLVTTGIYGFVRHPMYLGGVLMFFGAPLLMGSFFGLGVGLLMTVLLGMRTLGEEKMLLEEFGDYAQYKRKVKYRFIPFVW